MIASRPPSLLAPAALAAAILFTPLSRAQTHDPCEAVSCSGHGSCSIEDGEPGCTCEEGYIPDLTTGLSCLPQDFFEVKGKLAKDGAPESAAMTRRMALSGIVFSSLSLAAYIGKAHASSVYSVTMREDWENRRAFRAWWSLDGLDIAFHAVGSPLALASNIKVRRAMGLHPTTGANIAGWIISGSTYLIQLFQFLALSNIGGGEAADAGWIAVYVEIAFIFPSVCIAIHEAVQAIRNAGRLDRLSDVNGPVFTPFMTALRGGALMGVTGRF